MAENKGAIPKTRSGGITIRVPPKRPPAKSKTTTKPANESVYLCEICLSVDSKEKIRCDACMLWYHFACAKQNFDIVNQDVWMCVQCELAEQRHRSSSQVIDINSGNSADRSGLHSQQEGALETTKGNQKTSSVSSSVSRRASLALQRLEEERELHEIRENEARERQRLRDQEYLNQKYSILEDDNTSNLSFDDEEVDKGNYESIRKWRDNVTVANSNINRLNIGDTSNDNEIRSVEPCLNSTGVQQISPESVPTESSAVVTAGTITDQPLTIMEVSSADRDAVRDKAELPKLLTNPSTTSKSEFEYPRRIQTNPLDLTWPRSKPARISSLNTTFFNSANKQVPPVAQTVAQTVQQAPNYPTNVANSQTVAPATQNVQMNGNANYQPQLQIAASEHQPLSLSGLSQRQQVLCSNPSTSLNYTFDTTYQHVTGTKYQSSHIPTGLNTQQATTLSHQPVVSSYRTMASMPLPNCQSVGTTRAFGNSQPFVASQPFTVSQQFGASQPLGGNQSQLLGSMPQSFGNTQYYGTMAGNGSLTAQQSHILSGGQQSVGHGQRIGTYQPYVPTNAVFGLQNNNQVPVGQSVALNQNVNGINHGNVIPARLTAEQIAARQVMPKDLPIFNGDPLEWEAFISAYENSTETCGFTNSENLGRLQRCVKGDAKTAVRSLLFHRDSVPGVIETLRLLFGRPEVIMEKMISDLQKTPAPRDDDLPALIKFAISVQNLSATIHHFGEYEHLRNPMLINSITDKLPTHHRLNWAFYKQTIGNVHIGHLGDWLYQIAEVASRVVRGSSKPVKRQTGEDDKKSNQKSDRNSNPDMSGYVNAQIESNNKRSSAELSTKSTRKCPVCCQSSCQRIKECKKFVKLTPKERWAMVKEKELCFRCFGYHQIKKCKSKQKCDVGNCQKAHNPMLHEEEKVVASANSKATRSDTTEETTKVNCSHLSFNRHVDIFRIVPVKLYHKGKSVQTFAYLDDGSNVTTMENELADELNLDSLGQENLCVKWSFGKIRREELVSRRVSVRISGVQMDAAIYELNNVRTVNDLALPSQTITQKWLDSYEHFNGIPVTPYENAKPRMLIGLQYSKLMVSLKSVEGNWTEPIVCKTRLGWIVQGPDGGDDSCDGKNSKVQDVFSMNICECEHNDSNIHAMVKEFFSWENFGTKITDQILESKDIQRARKILESTTKKVNGRYETGLLWRYVDVKFPESYSMALKRLECLERKMEKDSILAEKMCEYIRDFICKGYVRKLTPKELEKSSTRVCYLPIFPVFNPKKPEKFRVVWDAAAMVNKVSLNSMLLAGPDLLVPLPDVLRRFRERPIGVTGDMKEMFHQVRVIESDVHAQRFLWRDGKSNEKPEIFVMEVLTFGGKNSPSSAQYVKNKNASEYKNQFPRAVDAITKNHYQDDMLESCDNVQEAVRLTEEVKMIHRNGGFELRSFKSNSKKVLEKLGEKSEDLPKNLDISIEPVTERVLGMFWKTSTDTFTFSLKYTKIPEDVLKGIRRPSKREVLSAIMSIFDPLGLIAHYLVHGKILLQKIWRDGTNWDENLSDSSYQHWLTWIEILPEIEKIEIPRWYSPKLVTTNRKRIQLHMFADAGGEACAATVYYRFEDDSGVDCCLIGAKTKVAPNKPLSVPRLELQAAVLGLRLVDTISNCQTIQVTERFFWSDSQTVLGWINSEARKFHQYVAFRVGEILEGSTPSEWNWVHTDDNVADDATKWKNKPDLSSTSRWYKAPSFLYQPQDTWNAGKSKPKFSTDEEMRAVYLLAHIEMPNHDIIDTKGFSDWNRLKRVVAYVLRFIDNSRLRNKNTRIGLLNRDEFVRARNTLLRQAQREDFLDEILIIRNNETLPVDERKELHKSSALRTCSPYLDEDGLLRIRGRIDAASALSFKTKRPIILPRHNHITKLIVYAYHQKFHHMNHKTTLNEVNQTFYVQALRVVLKNVIENMCQRCKNDKARPVIPEMAELPPARLSTFTRPFSYVGVDYFGPIKVKVRRSPEKRWGVIFTCLTTRAVYIDVAHSLNTSSCIFCVRNFINRCGQPLELFSDNGTNFHGTETELPEEFLKMNKDKMQEKFTNETTQWSFNPPTAAHMGGAWERLNRTVKSVLKKSLPTRLPTDEMLRSYLTEIENVINSRPLTYVELDHVDDEVLTPNHFLKGSSNGLKSPGLFDPKNLLRDDWKAVQEMTNRFWKQFVVEYLPTLTRRTKWFKDVKQLEVGDVVIVVDEQSDRNDWHKGIIEEVAMGKGKVRRARVRMIRGEKAKLVDTDVKKIKHQLPWRPAAKLAVLDVKGKKLNCPPEHPTGRGMLETRPN